MAAKIPRISATELKARLDRGEPVTLLDSRNPREWASSDRMLPGAHRVPADTIEQHLPPGRMSEPIVAYCT